MQYQVKRFPGTMFSKWCSLSLTRYLGENTCLVRKRSHVRFHFEKKSVDLSLGTFLSTLFENPTHMPFCRSIPYYCVNEHIPDVIDGNSRRIYGL